MQQRVKLINKISFFFQKSISLVLSLQKPTNTVELHDGHMKKL